MRHRALCTTFALLIGLGVQVAVASPATVEIPDRPEQLEFPPLEFEVPDADALRFELDSGVPVYAQEDRQFPLVNLSLYFRGGAYMTPDGKAGLAGVCGEVWRTGGAGERTAQELDEELDFLAANLSTSLGEVSGSVTLNLLSKDLEKGLAILMDVLTEPRFQDDRFAKAVDDAVQDMKRRNDDTAWIEARVWERLLYGEEHWKNALATQASVESLSRDDCRAFIDRLIRSGNIVIAASGDFEQARLQELLAETVGTLPALEKPVPPVPPPGQTAEPGVYVVDKQDVNQGRVSIGHLGYELGHPAEIALRAVNHVLGGSGFTARITKRVRSDEGLAYSAYSRISFPATYPGEFRAAYQSKSSTVPYAAEIVFDLIRQVRGGTDEPAPITADELETAKASFIETFPRRFESPAQTVATFALDELLDRPDDYWTTYRDKVRALTLDELTRAATEYLRPSEAIMLVVGNIDEIMQGHPDHDAQLSDFGEIHRVPLRDPLTQEPLPE